MTETALTMLALAVAFTSAGLAGLLALAEEAPGIVHPGSDAAGAPGELPLRRAFQVARLALMIVAGVSAAQAIGWWIRPPLGAFWTALVAATFLFLLADALPRMVASLAPELSAALAGAARRGVSGVAPLLTLVAAVERAVLSRVDHYDLSSTVPELEGVITTGESLARAFWQWLEPALPPGSLRRVAVVETANNVFEYSGDNPVSREVTR